MLSGVIAGLASTVKLTVAEPPLPTVISPVFACNSGPTIINTFKCCGLKLYLHSASRVIA